MSISITHYFEDGVEIEVEPDKDQLIEELRTEHDVDVEDVVCEYSGLITPTDLATWMSQLDPDREEEALLLHQFAVALGTAAPTGMVPQAEYDALQAKLDELTQSADAAQRLLFLAMVKNSENEAVAVQEVTNGTAC